MFKKFFTILILGLSFSMPIFGVSIHVPFSDKYDNSKSDYNVESATKADVKFEDKASHTFLLDIFDFVNEYLWWSFSVVCFGVVVYGGYCLITSNGDKKALKQGVWALVGSAIGIVIAMLSYTLINFLANIKFG